MSAWGSPAALPGRRFYPDLKTVLIVAVSLFLLVFNVFPMCYLVFRAFFGEGGFTLEAFRRIYSYSLNWNALCNTLVTAGLSMVFGVMIAFPLAWLVGRTDMYGRKFFRTLFVMTYMVPPYVGAMAWLRLLNPRVGTLNTWLADLFGLSRPSLQHLQHRRARMGADDVLLPLRLHHHLAGDGKNGPLP